jgi:hypothetical protein
MNKPFRDKPWYLAIFTSGRWVTTYPYINLPNDTVPEKFPWLVAHETVHLGQQEAMGKWKWYWRYFTSRAFRLDQEADGVVAEYKALVKAGMDPSQLFWNYSDDFTSRGYFWCASSKNVAIALLQAKLTASN